MLFYLHMLLSVGEALYLLLLRLNICSWYNLFNVITATIHLGCGCCQQIAGVRDRRKRQKLRKPKDTPNYSFWCKNGKESGEESRNPQSQTLSLGQGTGRDGVINSKLDNSKVLECIAEIPLFYLSLTSQFNLSFGQMADCGSVIFLDTTVSFTFW